MSAPSAAGFPHRPAAATNRASRRARPLVSFGLEPSRSAELHDGLARRGGSVLDLVVEPEAGLEVRSQGPRRSRRAALQRGPRTPVMVLGGTVFPRSVWAGHVTSRRRTRGIASLRAETKARAWTPGARRDGAGGRGRRPPGPKCRAVAAGIEVVPSVAGPERDWGRSAMEVAVRRMLGLRAIAAAVVHLAALAGVGTVARADTIVVECGRRGGLLGDPGSARCGPGRRHRPRPTRRVHDPRADRPQPAPRPGGRLEPTPEGPHRAIRGWPGGDHDPHGGRSRRPGPGERRRVREGRDGGVGPRGVPPRGGTRIAALDRAWGSGKAGGRRRDDRRILARPSGLPDRRERGVGRRRRLLRLGFLSLLDGCSISRNRADTGAGVACLHAVAPRLERCRVTANAAVWEGGGILASRTQDLLLDGCLVAGNEASEGGGLDGWESPVRLVRCTVAGNVASRCGGIRWLRSARSEVATSLTGCIVWDNAGGSAYLPWAATVERSCVEAPAVLPGDGNILADPFFCGWEARGEVEVRSPGDLETLREGFRYSLAPGSPCLGTGLDGANMGADQGTCEGPPGPSLTLRLDPGAYPADDFPLAHHVSVQGSGEAVCSIEGTLSGLRSGAFLANLTVTGTGAVGIRVGLDESPEIREVTVSGGSDPGTSGVSVSALASPRLRGCTIVGSAGFGVVCEEVSAPLFDGMHDPRERAGWRLLPHGVPGRVRRLHDRGEPRRRRERLQRLGLHDPLDDRGQRGRRRTRGDRGDLELRAAERHAHELHGLGQRRRIARAGDRRGCRCRDLLLVPGRRRVASGRGEHRRGSPALRLGAAPGRGRRPGPGEPRAAAGSLRLRARRVLAVPRGREGRRGHGGSPRDLRRRAPLVDPGSPRAGAVPPGRPGPPPPDQRGGDPGRGLHRGGTGARPPRRLRARERDRHGERSRRDRRGRGRGGPDPRLRDRWERGRWRGRPRRAGARGLRRLVERRPRRGCRTRHRAGALPDRGELGRRPVLAGVGADGLHGLRQRARSAGWGIRRRLRGILLGQPERLHHLGELGRRDRLRGGIPTGVDALPRLSGTSTRG